MNRLGEKCSQDSVARSRNGIMEWHYTAGKRKGKRCTGEGTEFVPVSRNDICSEAGIGRESYTKRIADMKIEGYYEFDEGNFVDNPYRG